MRIDSSRTIKPKKRLGQHFLINQKAIGIICEAALASPAPLIIEIGPGQGALTGLLLKDGRPLWAVDLDADACELLRRRYAGVPHLNILHGDAVSIELPATESLCIVGNLPYNAATAILARFLMEPVPWGRMVMMFQLEVGQKLMGRPGEKDYGPLSVLAQNVADMKTIIKLGPGSFSPPPKVDSIVLAFEPKPGAPGHDERKMMLSMLHRGFSHRRKTIANNWHSPLSAQEIDAICTAAGISPACRAESIPPGKWLEMARHLKSMQFLES
jgi:16S rRNA (adenine1518-N6/adenine1519-N6)-dimethyltransferase